MAAASPIFNVIIDKKGITLKKIKSGRAGYDKAKKNVILRERDAIELFQNTKAAEKDIEGVYSFQFLETAKTFAMLHLKVKEDEVANNLDHIQAYNGTADSSRS